MKEIFALLHNVVDFVYSCLFFDAGVCSNAYMCENIMLSHIVCVSI